MPDSLLEMYYSGLIVSSISGVLVKRHGFVVSVNLNHLKSSSPFQVR